MTTKPVPQGAHLVGSIPVDTAEEAFRVAMQNLGGQLRRIPDGEVGERDYWIRWQHEKIGKSPQLRKLDIKNTYVPVKPFGIKEGIDSADDIELPSLGYADAAIESWSVFKRLKDEGVIADGVRFQVGMPTPLSVSLFYVEADSRALFEQAYGNALKLELEKMLMKIPSDCLAIQWETVTEFAMLEGLINSHLDGDLMEAVTDRVAALVDAVPGPVHAGLHLCYGDSGHKHFCEPKDSGYLADVMAGVLGKVSRVVNWIHLPVPKERDDPAYFAPLARVKVPEATEIYLGLVHRTGGLEGTRRRIEAAKAILPAFGVATECGLGRRDPGTIAALLRQHATVTATNPD